VRGVLRGFIAVVMGVMLSTSPVSAATPTTSGGETVIAAQVMPVRHVVVDSDGVILRIVSNTSENVAPHVYLGSFTGAQISMTAEVNQRYENLIAKLDMQRPADYVRKQPLDILLTQFQHLSALHLRVISQIELPRPLL